MKHNLIYIAYKHSPLSKKLATQYEQLLSAIGYRPWLDKYKIRAGDLLRIRIQKAIDHSCSIVFLITSHFKYDGVVKEEISLALQKREKVKQFRIVVLDFTDGKGKVPQQLLKDDIVIMKPINHLDGFINLLAALPEWLGKYYGYLSLSKLIPQNAKQVAIAGQNLVSRLKDRGFLKELNLILKKESIQQVVLLMMTPKALRSIHPRAAIHMEKFSIRGLEELKRKISLKNSKKIYVAFHPMSTLSLIGVDWSDPRKAFAYITPNFQITQNLFSRLTLYLDGKSFDHNSLGRMILDAEEKNNGAIGCPLTVSPSLIKKLVKRLN